MPASNLKKLIQQRRNRESIYSTAEFWDGKAEEMQGDAVSMWRNNHLNHLYQEEQASLIREAFPDVSGLRILDIGCGTGRLSRWFASQGAQVTGVDFSEKALQIARAQTADSNVRYIHLSMFELEYAEEYDAAFSWGSMTIACKEASELADVMHRVHSALVPGGRLLLLEPVHKGFLHRVLNMGTGDFLREMKRAGFDVEWLKNLHFWPARILLAYISWPAWLTRAVYHFGQRLMLLPFFGRMGDYKAISAKRPA